MPIEKAFAIRSTPDVIFRAIERDLRGDADQPAGIFEELRREPDRLLQLRVNIGMIPCWLTYTLTLKPDYPPYTEVAATLVPFGWRYTMFRIMTFGMRDQGFEIALVEGLANLKAAVEGGDEDGDGELQEGGKDDAVVPAE